MHSLYVMITFYGYHTITDYNKAIICVVCVKLGYGCLVYDNLLQYLFCIFGNSIFLHVSSFFYTEILINSPFESN